MSIISKTPGGHMSDHRVWDLRTQTICVNVGKLFTLSVPGLHTYKIIESTSSIEFED